MEVQSWHRGVCYWTLYSVHENSRQENLKARKSTVKARTSTLKARKPTLKAQKSENAENTQLDIKINKNLKNLVFSL